MVHHTVLLGDADTFNLKEFASLIQHDLAPQSLQWLSILHRMQSAESVVHPVRCDGCSRDPFYGFRYKCTVCQNFQLCQACFWRGIAANRHPATHAMKEYTSYTHPPKARPPLLKAKTAMGVADLRQSHEDSIQQWVNDSSSRTGSSLKSGLSEEAGRGGADRPVVGTPGAARISDDKTPPRTDEEHKLIARYVHTLADERHRRSSSEGRAPPLTLDLHVRTIDLIRNLEDDNKHILQRISEIRHTETTNPEPGASLSDTDRRMELELELLRQHRKELDMRMISLQNSRQQLAHKQASLTRFHFDHAQDATHSNSASPHVATKLFSPSGLSNSSASTPYKIIQASPSGTPKDV